MPSLNISSLVVSGFDQGPYSLLLAKPIFGRSFKLPAPDRLVAH